MDPPKLVRQRKRHENGQVCMCLRECMSVRGPGGGHLAISVQPAPRHCCLACSRQSAARKTSPAAAAATGLPSRFGSKSVVLLGGGPAAACDCMAGLVGQDGGIVAAQLQHRSDSPPPPPCPLPPPPPPPPPLLVSRLRWKVAAPAALLCRPMPRPGGSGKRPWPRQPEPLWCWRAWVRWRSRRTTGRSSRSRQRRSRTKSRECGQWRTLHAGLCSSKRWRPLCRTVAALVQSADRVLRLADTAPVRVTASCERTEEALQPTGPRHETGL